MGESPRRRSSTHFQLILVKMALYPRNYMYVEDVTGVWNNLKEKNENGEEWLKEHNHCVHVTSPFLAYISVYCYNETSYRNTPPELWRCDEVFENTIWENDVWNVKGRVVLDECPSNKEPGSLTKCARK